MPSTSAITGGSSEHQDSALTADSPAQSPVGSEHAMNASFESAGSGAGGAHEVVMGADGVAIERRKDHEFIPTRMKTIQASRPVANPQQYTRVPSNPLLVSAQRQMELAEEVKRQKEMARRNSERNNAGETGDDEPEWASNLSSWKSRRRKQSEDAMMRVAEIKGDDEGNDGERMRKMSLGKKLSGLLHTGDENDWSDLGLESLDSSGGGNGGGGNGGQHSNGGSSSNGGTPHISRDKSRSKSKSPEVASIREAVAEDDEYEEGGENGGGGGGDDVGDFVNDSEMASSSSSVPQQLERWTSSNSLRQEQSEPSRRKSSEVSASMKIRLEAFEDRRKMESLSDEARAKEKFELDEHEEQFKEKLKTFQKISSRGELGSGGKVAGLEAEDKKPPPPLKYKDLINPQNYQSSSTMPDEDDASKDLELALDESFRSILGNGNKENREVNSGTVFKDQDFAPTAAPPIEKPPPPPPAANTADGGKELDDSEVDKQEREIIASLEMEEREHKRYTARKSSAAVQVQAYENTMVSSSQNRSHSTSSNSSSRTSSQQSSPRSHQQQQQQQYPQKQPQKQQQQQMVPKKKDSSSSQKNYNQHWLIQEAEQRRIAEMQQRGNQYQSNSKSSSSAAASNKSNNTPSPSGPIYENSSSNKAPAPSSSSPSSSHFQPTQSPIYSNTPQQSKWSPPQQTQKQQQPGVGSHNENLYANLSSGNTNGPPPPVHSQQYPPRDAATSAGRIPGPQVPPRNAEGASTSPGASSSSSSSTQQQTDRMLSVSGKKKCSHCKEELGRGAAMIIESLRLFYHLRCFQCCVCHVQLGNGSAGTDVRVRNNKLHCQNCYSNDEGLKFSKV